MVTKIMHITQGFTREYYDRACIWSENEWKEEETKRARQTVALLPNVHSVLDVGCGAGIVTQEMVRRFPSIVGLDFAFEPLRQVKKAGIQVIQGDACALPFYDKTFDAIVATEIIEHLTKSSRRLTLKEMARVARKYILLTVPYREVLEEGQVKCKECGCIFHGSRHSEFFDEAKMASLLSPEFKLITTQTFGPVSKRIPHPLIMLAQYLAGMQGWSQDV